MRLSFCIAVLALLHEGARVDAASQSCSCPPPSQVLAPAIRAPVTPACFVYTQLTSQSLTCTPCVFACTLHVARCTQGSSALEVGHGDGVYLGNGCFWHTQYDMYLVELQAPFNRSTTTVTSRTGQVQAQRSDCICMIQGVRCCHGCTDSVQSWIAPMRTTRPLPHRVTCAMPLTVNRWHVHMFD